MAAYKEAFEALNDAQRAAVLHTDGPLLVLAGPGTGKTQLLSVRAAHILEATDTPARNILCLTFTDSGAANMRERIGQLVGPAASDITITTYHAFGGDLMQRYPEYFGDVPLETAVDELGRHQIISTIVDNLPYRSPLYRARHHLSDLIATISEVKRALLAPDDLREIAQENTTSVQAINRDLAILLRSFTRIPKFTAARQLFEKIEEILALHAPEKPANARFGSLMQAAILSLRIALDEAIIISKTTPLTAWKNDWLVKNAANILILDGEPAAYRLEALADVLEQYETALQSQQCYDYDDMILQSIAALERHDNLRFTLQEQYLYIMLDEYQDTNAAQARLVELLTNNPISEGRPNVMAVGDDDQAIYAFQGALYSNLRDFYRQYQDTRVIRLTENYRSHPAIVTTATRIADQITERAGELIDAGGKELQAANRTLAAKQVHLERRSFLSDIGQASWLAEKVAALVQSGVPANQIAVLAPRHKQLEPLVPYLNHAGVFVHYEKRENILEAPVVRQLLTMCRLVVALYDGHEAQADQLWPEVLSYDFWQYPTSALWEISWQVADARAKARAADEPAQITWSRALLQSTIFRVPALLFLTIATEIASETAELILDYLIGSATIATHEADLPNVYSPLRDYYTSEAQSQEHPELLYQTVSHLSVLRARLRAHQQGNEAPLTIRDLLAFVDSYAATGERMMNTSPYVQSTDAVQLMTVYKAKGLEFKHVFVVSLQDDVWGSAARGQSNRLGLPANLMAIRYAGTTDDERRRLFYVAVTRAKQGLYLTSVTQNYSGKIARPLSYLLENSEESGSVDAILPEPFQKVTIDTSAPPSLAQLELDWRTRHAAGAVQPTLRALLAPRVEQYHATPTHLSQFLDLEYAGPERFFMSTILKFPEAPTPDGQFGNAIHETLQWVQLYVSRHSTLPLTEQVIAQFTGQMRSKKLGERQTTVLLERGEQALEAYIAQRGEQYQPSDQAEVAIRTVTKETDDTPLAGKIDRLEINPAARTITIVDYKTGKNFNRWLRDAKLHKYRRQLYGYNLLLTDMPRFAGYHVIGGRLEFVEPDENGHIHTLSLIFDPTQLERTRQLLHALWQHVIQLDFPDVSGYAASLTGIEQFEHDLINGYI